jgi:hypothetical protein
LGIGPQGISMKREDTGAVFRAAIGIFALAAGIVGFGALFWIEIPARNENALMFAMGIVFGWGSAVIASEYGATTTGRKVAESAIRKIERNDEHETVDVNVVNEEDHPVPIKEEGKKK